MKILDFLKTFNGAAIQLVGSRVTCIPPPTETDQDVLCFVEEGDVGDVINGLESDGWKFDGSAEYANALHGGVGFRSYRHGEVNLILTSDFDFYSRFMAATSVAKRLNLLDKTDRIALFQAVIYGNPCTEIDLALAA